jgi:asparagine synthase (glutamine-hydrolysing)
MCGICGIVYADRSHPVSEPQLQAMTDALVHRGPDDGGQYVGQGIGLGSRRLAILDLSPRGHMPMSTEDGRFWITYNGEIYNYRELRAELGSRARRFRSDTDTEVLLALYAAHGPAMLDRLNGMFAFAIWDARCSTLFAARDRLGIKPLYYDHQPDALLLASEEKALFAAGVPRHFDADVWEELLCFRYVAGERTPYAGVKRLLPGHYLLFSNGHLQIRRWWRYAERVRDLRARAPRDGVRWFQETFDNAVDQRRISDVPVGVLLSGGLDSGSVAASLSVAAGRGVASFTVRFDEPGFDEGILARQVAHRWGLAGHELTLTPSEVAARLPYASWLNDEPLAHASDVHLGAIAQYAKPEVTVLLSGEGADELLGGYVRYVPLRFAPLLRAGRPLLSRLPDAGIVGHRARKLSRFLRLGSLRDFGLFNACDVLPDELRRLGMTPSGAFPYRRQIWDQAEALFPGDLMRQAMFSDQHTFLCSLLDRNDRMTMGASIECRVPFLDYRLVEGVGALPSRLLLSGYERKPLLRRAFATRLPSEVRRHRKWGFGVPWSRYLRAEPAFREMLHALPRLEPVVSGPFAAAKIASTVQRFLAGDETDAPVVRQLVMVTVWYQACCQGHDALHRVHGTPQYTADTIPGFAPPAPRWRNGSPPLRAPVGRGDATVPDRSEHA